MLPQNAIDKLQPPDDDESAVSLTEAEIDATLSDLEDFMDNPVAMLERVVYLLRLRQV